MSRSVFKLYTGICPRSDCYQTIQIKYTAIPIMGQDHPGYKKMSFSCDDVSDSSHLDQWGRCPLLLEAPDEP